ncbi:MAG: hypothetical protein ACR2IH_04200 [Pyrinomonadaceae bacterium]
MSKQVISVDGEDRVVREDTAKAFRGTYWALWSIGAFIVVAALLYFGLFGKLLLQGKTDKPNEAIQNQPFR